MPSTQFTLYITNEGIAKARETLTNPGWYLIPYKIGIASSRGVIDATRTYASMDVTNTWYLDYFSGVTAGTTDNKLIHSVVVPPTITGYTTSQNYGELYFIYKDHNGNEFLYAIGAPQTTLTWTPGVSQQFYFAFTLNNTTVADTFTINYTYPQDIADHNTDTNAHEFFLKKDGSRLATGILSYDSSKTFSSDNNIINKKYVDNIANNKASIDLNNLSTTGENKLSPDIIQLASSGTITLTTNAIHKITVSGAITFSLPSPNPNTKLNQMLVQLQMASVQSINVGTSHYFNGKAPSMGYIGNFDLIYEYDKANSWWVVGWMSKS